MLKYANPTNFLALAARLIPWLAWATAITLAARTLSDLFRRARRLSAGRLGQDHVSACARRLARHDVLHGHGVGRARHAGLAPSARRRRAKGRRAAWRRFHLALSRHRLAVGQADVGHMVGVGRAADLGAGAVPDLSRPDRRCGGPSRIRPRPRAPPRFSRWSAWSIFRSSNFRSIGGTRCTSRLRCSASAARPLPLDALAAAGHGRWPSRCCSSPCI